MRFRVVLAIVVIGFLMGEGLAAQSGDGKVPPFKRELSVTNPRMNGADVMLVQKRLLELGYAEVGTADGYYGPLTGQAVSRFLFRQGADRSAIVNQEAWNLLFSSYVVQVHGEQLKDKLSVVLAVKGKLVGSTKSDGVWMDDQKTGMNLDGGSFPVRVLGSNSAWAQGSGAIEWGDANMAFGCGMTVNKDDDYVAAMQSNFTPQPRPIVKVPHLSEQLSKLVTESLRDRGMADVGTVQVWSSDWNADGVSDYIVSSESEDMNEEGAHSVVFVLNGLKSGGFDKPVWVAESARPGPDTDPQTGYDSYEFVTALDTNGDGVYEFIVIEHVVDGWGCKVIKVDKGSVKTLVERWDGV